MEGLGIQSPRLKLTSNEPVKAPPFEADKVLELDVVGASCRKC